VPGVVPFVDDHLAFDGREVVGGDDQAARGGDLQEISHRDACPDLPQCKMVGDAVAGAVEGDEGIGCDLADRFGEADIGVRREGFEGILLLPFEEKSGCLTRCGMHAIVDGGLER